MNDRKEREGLRECPFCLKGVSLKPAGDNIAFIVCDDGPCKGSGLFIGVVLDRKDTAFTAWNRRPTEATSQGGGDGTE